MKKSVYVLLATVLLVAFLTTQGISQPFEKSDQNSKYSDLIDEAIAKCQNKSSLLNSRSPNIRKQAIRACLKGAYLKVNKNELVAYLITVDAEPSRDRVEYHLNKRFYQSMKPDEMYVLLEASQLLNHSK